ncbi:UNVERIFIED_ORG: Flp pilus assembly protein TadG [Citrobacter freundii]
MKIYNKFHIRRFIQRGNAGVSIMFAIILPVLIATFSLGIDGSRFLIKRARLADALSQGSFAVASTNSNLTTEPEKIEGKELVKSYINYYIPGNELDESTLAVSANIDVDPDDSTKINSIEYVATAKIIAHPIIDGISRALPGFNKDVPIIADENNGIVRKTIGKVNIESDIAFAVDFSGSMLGMSSDGKLRIQVLRDVVNDLSSQIANEKSKSKIAIVPFDIGIPVKLEEKNEAGGERIGCATPYKFKDKYDIDLAFWANKKIDWTSSGNNTSGPDREDIIKSYLDLKRYDYYSNHVKAAGVNYKVFCTSNVSYDNSAASGKINSNPLSCEAVKEVSAVSSSNYIEIKNYSQIIQDYFNPLISDSESQSFANDTTIDYTGTINESFLFNEKKSNIFERPFASIDMGNPFKEMCLTGFNFSGIPPAWGPENSIPEGYPYWRPDNYYSEYLSQVKQNAYVIGLSSDKSEIDKFQSMWPMNGAGTDIVAGMLYAAREVAKGDNPRKIIIVVTDGEEYGEQQTVAFKFRKPEVCQKIMDGVKNNSKNTKEVKIYFVSIVNNYMTGSVLYDWKKNCVGEDGAFVATDYSALKDAITSIFSSEPGGLKFINKSDMIVP